MRKRAMVTVQGNRDVHFYQNQKRRIRYSDYGACSDRLWIYLDVADLLLFEMIINFEFFEKLLSGKTQGYTFCEPAGT